MSVNRVKVYIILYLELAVAAQYTEDNKWYRAKVLRVKNGKITVNYVDFGNAESLSPVRVRLIPEEYTRLTVQVNCTYFYGAEKFCSTSEKSLPEND